MLVLTCISYNTFACEEQKTQASVRELYRFMYLWRLKGGVVLGVVWFTQMLSGLQFHFSVMHSLSLPSGAGAVLPQSSNSVVTISDLIPTHPTISLGSSCGKKKNLLSPKPSAGVSCLKDLHELMNTPWPISGPKSWELELRLPSRAEGRIKRISTTTQRE